MERTTLPRRITKRLRNKAIRLAKKEWSAECHCIHCMIKTQQFDESIYVKKRSVKLYKELRMEYLNTH